MGSNKGIMMVIISGPCITAGLAQERESTAVTPPTFNTPVHDPAPFVLGLGMFSVQERAAT